ncbi:MAG TPA: hypothetical protein VFZ77_15915 [Acidimicrobiales bacterium]
MINDHHFVRLLVEERVGELRRTAPVSRRRWAAWRAVGRRDRRSHRRP